jgi:hypothetical protein
MIDEDLRALLRGGEGSRVEFKETGNRDTVKKAAVAFANRLWEPEPAVLFLGVRNDGTVVGVANRDNTIRDARRYVEECFPPIDHYEVRPLDHEGRVVVAVIIWESPAAPHFTGKAFVRRGAESLEASADMYETLIGYRSSAARHLGPWVRRDIDVEYERVAIGGTRTWMGSPQVQRLVSVDAVGIVLDIGGLLRADWGRVILQPDVPGQRPYIRLRS